MKSRRKIFAFVSFVLIISSLFSVCAFADETYNNDETSYNAVVKDEADLLTDSEEKSLIEKMEPVTKYGNAMFYSVYGSYYDISDEASYIYHSEFSTASGTIFIIDMNLRKIYIFSDGKIYDEIDDSTATTITDNVYRYAKKGDYYSCAAAAFNQISDKLGGNPIPQTMKYISTALTALVAGISINFAVLTYQRGKYRANSSEKKHVKETGGPVRLVKGELKSSRKIHDDAAAIIAASTVADIFDDGDFGGGGFGGGGFGGGSSGGGFGGGGGSSGGGGGHGF